MESETIIIFLILANLLVYTLAFFVSRIRYQNIKIYAICLAIQIILLVLQFSGFGYSGGNDAAGAGMEKGFMHIVFIGLQSVIITIVLIIFVARQISRKIPIQLLTVATILLVLYFFVFVDYRLILISMRSTNVNKLSLREGVMYEKGKPFTGISMYKGKLESYPKKITPLAPDDTDYYYQSVKQAIQYKTGMRTTQYKNGIKEGEEKLYYTHNNCTALHCITQYHKGLKNGTEIVVNESSGNRETEAHYTNGVLHGLYKEYYKIDKNFPDEKIIAKNIGPLQLEIEYKNGEQSGIYRTYSSYGDTIGDYVIEKGEVLYRVER